MVSADTPEQASVSTSAPMDAATPSRPSPQEQVHRATMHLLREHAPDLLAFLKALYEYKAADGSRFIPGARALGPVSIDGVLCAIPQPEPEMFAPAMTTGKCPTCGRPLHVAPFVHECGILTLTVLPADRN